MVTSKTNKKITRTREIIVKVITIVKVIMTVIIMMIQLPLTIVMKRII